jgi:hypothetical protein
VIRRLPWALPLLAVLAGCGSSEPPRPAATVRPPALPARAVPYLDSTTRVLTPANLARETRLDALPRQLTQWGFAGATVRTFQGESKRLQVVESRTLRFRSPGGATAFLRLVRANLGAFYPGALTPRPFVSRGRHGLVVKAAPCTCHMASPAYLGVVAAGPTVTWLAINGPRATVRTLTRLAAQAP